MFCCGEAAARMLPSSIPQRQFVVQGSQVASLLLPPLNDGFDLRASRFAAGEIHVHSVIAGFLVGLAPLAGVLTGHAQFSKRRADWLNRVAFPALSSVTLYFILDFEYPRLGFITLESAGAFLGELRESLKSRSRGSD
jgi:hypothetical protein